MKITDIGPWIPGTNVTGLLAEAVANACATNTKDKVIAIPPIDDLSAGLPLVDAFAGTSTTIQFTAPGVEIVGAGPASGVQINPASVTSLTSSYSVFYTAGQSKTRFSNFRIDGQRAAISASLIAQLTPSLGAAGAASAVANCSMGFELIYCGISSGAGGNDCAIVDMTGHDVFNGVAESFCFMLAGTTRGRVQRCHVYNVTGTGIHVAGHSTSVYTVVDSFILDNYVHDCTWMSISDYIAQRSTIHRNKCRNAGRRNINYEWCLGGSYKFNDCDTSQWGNIGAYGQVIDCEVDQNMSSNADQANFGLGELDFGVSSFNGQTAAAGTVRIGTNFLMPTAGKSHITVSERSAVTLNDSAAAQIVISDPNADQYLITATGPSGTSPTNWRPNSVFITGTREGRPAQLGLLSSWSATNGINGVTLGGDLAPQHGRRFTANANALAIFTPNYSVQSGQWVKVAYSVAPVDANVNWLIGFPVAGAAQAVRIPNLSTDLVPNYFSGHFYFHVADGGSAVQFQIWNEATSTSASILVVGAIAISTVPAPPPSLPWGSIPSSVNQALALGFASENPN